MTTVQVKDEAGNPLASVRVGDTKLQALQRLSPRRGILVDKDDLGLLDSDTVSIERGPYVLKDNTEKTWEDKAAAADGGKGLALEECNPDNDTDMTSLYPILLEENQKEDIAAQKRLKRFIRKKRRDAGGT